MDFDAEHQTFFRRYPFSVQLFPFESEKEAVDGFSVIGKYVVANTITLIDIRSQATSLLLSGMAQTDFFSIVSDTGGKITVFLYVGDDPDTMTSIQRVLEFCGDKVDYVAILNPAISPVNVFLKSPILTKLKHLGTSFVRVPYLSESCRLEIQEIEYRLNESVGFFDIVTNEDSPVSLFARFELRRALKSVVDQYEKIQAILLPDRSAGNSPVVSTEDVLGDLHQKFRKPVDPALLYGS